MSNVINPLDYWLNTDVCYPVMWTIMFKPFFFFVCVLGSFYPLCVRSPLDTLESGVLFHIWWLSIHLLVLHDKSTMESSVVSSLPDVYLHPHARKHGVERSTMKHSSNLRSPHMWVILLIIHHQLSYLRENWPLMDMRFRLGLTFFRDADPHKSYGENLLVYHPWKIEQP